MSDTGGRSNLDDGYALITDELDLTTFFER